MTSGLSEFEHLRELLVSPEVSALHTLECDIDDLRRQINDPGEFAALLRPVIAGVFQHGDPALSLALIKAITPFLDRALRDRALENPAGIADALAPASTGAIALHYANSPGSAARDLAPLVSASIKEQIRGERDAMIDALYPIMGSTISKYLSQTLTTLLQSINERIESHLSLASIVRRTRARFMGLSDAEMLIRESMPWRLDAAFLIHKSSGLVITQAQNEDASSLDADLLSGMLTAIRSLFNDSLMASQAPRELDQIEYGESKIVLEVAGFCYLAAVGRGIPDESFRLRMRETLTSIVQSTESGIERYTGDPAHVPASVSQSIAVFVRSSHTHQEARKAGTIRPLLVAAGVLIVFLSIPLAIHLYRNARDRDTETRTRSALLADGPFAFADVTAKADGGSVSLSGRTPNEYQSARAEAVARAVSPGFNVENHTTPDPDPPLPIITAARVNEVAAALNTMDGVYLESRFDERTLVVDGFAPDSSLVPRILRSFDGLPGIQSFKSHVSVGSPEIGVRLYFPTGFATISPEARTRLVSIGNILRATPWSRLLITGHTDSFGSDRANRLLAIGRANAVRAALAGLGIPEERMAVMSTTEPPPGTPQRAVDSLLRCVRFSLRAAHGAEPR